MFVGKQVHSRAMACHNPVLSLFIDGQWIDAPKGSFVIAAGGTKHDFENRTSERAGVLNVSVPGDFEPQMPAIAAWFRDRSPSDARTTEEPAKKPRAKRA